MARTDLSALLLAAKTAEIWRKEEVKTLTTSGSYDEAPGAAQIHSGYNYSTQRVSGTRLHLKCHKFSLEKRICNQKLAHVGKP